MMIGTSRSVNIQHQLPGRLRLQVDRLAGRPTVAQRVETVLASTSGVRAYRVNLVLGHVLVLFDPARTGAPQLCRVIRLAVSSVTPGEASQAGHRRRAAGTSRVSTGVSDLDGNGLAPVAATAEPTLIPTALPADSATNTENAQIVADGPIPGALVDSPLRSAGLPRLGWTGLQARQLLARYGPNALVEPRSPSIWRRVLDQFRNSMALTLLGGAALSAFIGRWRDAATIAASLLLNAGVSAVQAGKADGSLAALKRLTPQRTRVWRDGLWQAVPTAEVVPGDVVWLETGDSVPADLVLLRADSLQAEESMLTGESLPAEKTVAERPTLESVRAELAQAVRPVLASPASSPAPLGTAASVRAVDLPDRLYAGTTITRGHGIGWVTATGMHTQMGRLAALLQEIPDRPTPLQERMDKLGRSLVKASLGAVAGFIALGILRGIAPWEMLMAGTSLAVAAVPEGMPTFVTLGLAAGVRRLARQQALVRRLQAIEALGNATAICTDKTGTLTCNELTVRQVFTNRTWFRMVGGEGYTAAGQLWRIRARRTDVSPSRDLDPATARMATGSDPNIGPSEWLEPVREPLSDPQLRLLALGSLLCNDAQLQPVRLSPGSAPKPFRSTSICTSTSAFTSTPAPAGWTVQGDAVDGALQVWAARLGLPPDERLAWERLAEWPFEAARRRMSARFRREFSTEALFFTKGAPETVLALCDRVLLDGRPRPLTPAARRQITAAVERMADSALRVLAVAYRPEPAKPAAAAVRADDADAADAADNADAADAADAGELNGGLIFLGLVGLMDPPRPNAARAVALCRQAGVRVLMLTGDHLRTAVAVAKEIGLLAPGDLMLTGEQIDRLTQPELEEAVGQLRVAARCSPENKLRIVRALRAKGHVVAMTGDGVNDSLSVKEADIGVAMGQTGTETTRQAAGLILTDDEFATLVTALQQGRATYANIRKAVRYLLASNAGELIVMGGALAFGWPLALTPLQLLWVNLVGDGAPALALIVQPPNGSELHRPPRPRGESLFADGVGQSIVRDGLQMGLVGLGLYGWGWRSGRPLPVVRTLTLTGLLLGQILYFLRCRREADGCPPLSRGNDSRQTEAGVRRRDGPGNGEMSMGSGREGSGADESRGPRAVWAAVAVSLGLLGLSVYVRPVRQVLGLAPLSPEEWLIAGVGGVLGAATFRGRGVDSSRGC